MSAPTRRQPKGIRTGGQFAATGRTEAEVTVTQQAATPSFAADDRGPFTEKANVNAGRPSWGVINSTYPITTGITEVSCEGHGGVKLSPERNRLVPAPLRKPGGWYEEDCDAHIAAATFPEAYTSSDHPYYSTMTVDGAREEAMERVREWSPDEYEQATGVTVTAEQSRIVAAREYEDSHREDFLTISASDAGDGFVSLQAHRASDGAETYFRMSREQYRAAQAELRGASFGVAVPEDTPRDAAAIAKRAQREDAKAARFAEHAERAQTRFWGNVDKLTPREQERLEAWENELRRLPDGSVLTNAEMYEREPVHGVQQIPDGSRVKWYANMLGTEDDHGYVREIPAVVAKVASVPDTTSEDTRRRIAEDRAAAKREREAKKRWTDRW